MRVTDCSCKSVMEVKEIISVFKKVCCAELYSHLKICLNIFL